MRQVARSCRLPRSQTGVALISVLLIVAILMAVASRLLANHNLVINQHQNTFEYDQALHYALGAETLARQALFQDMRDTEFDHRGELWAQDILPFELDEGGYLEAQVTDLHGCFNLNSLSVVSEDKRELKQVERMTTMLGIPKDLVHAWADWVDANSEITGLSGAEEGAYLVANPAYRTPNTPVTSLSELQLLANVDQQHLATLLPHVCLLPDSGTEINVNTASAAVLASLLNDDNGTLATGEQIAAEPREFESVADFVTQHQVFNGVDTNGLTVESSYFALHVEAKVGQATVSLYSLIYRDRQNERVTVLARDFGKLFRSNVQIDIEPA